MSISTYGRPPRTLKTDYVPPSTPVPLPPSRSPRPQHIQAGPASPENLHPARPRSFIPGYTRYKHVFPGAYPRSINGVVILTGSPPLPYESNPFGPVTGQDKKERLSNIRKAAAIARQERVKVKTRTRQDMDKTDEPAIWLAADRWVRDVRENEASSTKTEAGSSTSASHASSSTTEQKEAITLIFLHANGFHKEMYEPAIRHLVELIESSPSEGIQVDEIWTIDHYNHAESYELNRDVMGKVVAWSDFGRDVLSFLENSLPPPATIEDPTRTDRKLIPSLNKSKTGSKRKIIGIGHSVGGVALVQAAQERPELFHSLILIDPMTRILDVSDLNPNKRILGAALIESSIGRRDTWPSRETARTDLLRSPYFQAWDPEVFEIFIQHGLSDPNGSVVLATPRWCEAATFCDWKGMPDAYDRLGWLDEKLKLNFILADDNSSTGGTEKTQLMSWRHPNSENVIIDGTSHLLVQEKPKLVAQEIFRALCGRPVVAKERVDTEKAKL